MGDDGAEAAAEKLLNMGQPAMEAVLARFPGRNPPPRPDLRIGLATLEELGPFLSCLGKFDRPLIAGLSPLLNHSNDDTRFFATYIMAMLNYPESVVLLASRLQDEDPGIRLVAAFGLDHMREFPHFRVVQEDLLRNLENSVAETRRNGCEGIARLLDRNGIPGLLSLLEDQEPEVMETASWALVELTRHDFGLDAGRWRDWWNRNRDFHRMEWLMDALTQADGSNRQAAFEELFAITGLSFGYDPEMEADDLLDAQEKFLDWWRRIGVHQLR